MSDARPQRALLNTVMGTQADVGSISTNISMITLVGMTNLMFHLKASIQKYGRKHHFHYYFIKQVTWPRLTAEEVEKATLPRAPQER